MAAMAMKTCTKCNEEKPLDQFPRRLDRPSGNSSWCRSCHNGAARRYGHTKHARKVKSASGRKYRQTEHGQKVVAKRRKKYMQSDKGRAAARRGEKVYKDKYPEKIKAKDAVHNAIRSGKLPKASDLFCGQCIFNYKLVPAQHYHHNSYKEEDRLIVHALCAPCHVKEHDNA